MSNRNLPIIRSGKILIYKLYDVANEIDLFKLEQKLEIEAKRLKIERKPFSKAYDFGVVSIILEIPLINIDIPSFEELAFSLEDNKDIDNECRNQLTQAISIMGDSLSGFNISRIELLELAIVILIIMEIIIFLFRK